MVWLYIPHQINAFPSINNTANFAFIFLVVIPIIVKYQFKKNNQLDNLSLYPLYQGGFSTITFPSVSVTYALIHQRVCAVSNIAIHVLSTHNVNKSTFKKLWAIYIVCITLFSTLHGLSIYVQPLHSHIYILLACLQKCLNFNYSYPSH